MVQGDMISELRKRGLKLTPQRIEIINALNGSMGEHPTLNNLYHKIKKKMPTVSFSTLYNTISTMEKNGMICLFDHKGETRVDMNVKGHLNIIDTETGKIIDIGDESVVKKVLSELDIENTDGRRILVNVLLY